MTQPPEGPSPRLTHVDESGAARMVAVPHKPVTTRVATAAGRVLVSPEVVSLLRGSGVPKGDAVAVARIAGIAGAKRTPDLIPLCHPIALHGVTVDLTVADDAVEIVATARDRKSTRLNSSHTVISYAVFCLKKKKGRQQRSQAGPRGNTRRAAAT